jgi:YesN/AraC family two-component response regulator
MSKLQTLWVDATLSVKDGELPAGFRERCETTYCSEPEKIDEILARRPIDLICFDFDYPDRTGLRVLRDTKVAHPSVPVVMLTVQHSESLAIWAFRAKITDYLVKPVPLHEAERCLVALLRALNHRRTQSPRAAALHPSKIPDEISFTPKAEDSSLGAAISYVEQNFRSKVRGDDAAALCGLSPFRFSRLFKDTYGLTFRDYLVNFRLKEACRLLENPSVTVADVAFAVGFQDPSYFTRIFKHRVGTAPSLLIGQRASVADQLFGPLSASELPQIG